MPRNTKTEITKSRRSAWNEPGGLDIFLTKVVLERTVGEAMVMRDTSVNARTYFVGRVIIDAIFEKDMAAIEQIAMRIDGTIPDEDERDGYANIFGDAIEDVLEYENINDVMTVMPDDKCIIAIAKSIVAISISDPGMNVQKRKNKQSAVNMILARTGGKKTKPTMPEVETKYEDPDWLTLPQSKPNPLDSMKGEKNWDSLKEPR